MIGKKKLKLSDAMSSSRIPKVEDFLKGQLKREDLEGVKNTLLVYIDEFGATSINILIYCFSRSPDWEDWLQTKENVMIQISRLVEKNHCEFAYPTQVIHLKKEAQIEDLS